MAIVQNLTFYQGRMEKDASPELLPEGVYRDAINLRPVDIETGSVGTLTNVTGNDLVSYTFTQLGEDPFIRVIGSKLDLKRRRLYWLVYGQNDSTEQYAYILYYSYETQDITTVFSFDNVLDFDPNFVIDNITIDYDDEIGDTLSWVDDNSEPKEVNVTAGANRFNNYTQDTSGFVAGDIVFADTEDGVAGLFQFIPCRALTATNDFPNYSYTTGELDTADWEVIPVGQCYPPFVLRTMFYQKPITPYWSPSAKYNYDDGTEDVEGVSTFLRRRSYQFAYSYVFFNGQESELSPFSEAVFSQELTSGVFTIGEDVANPDFPTPLSISVKVPIHSFRYTDSEDVESIVEMPHAMIARVKLYIREVPTRLTPTDWLEWEDINYEDFYKYNISSANISDDFPVAGDAGTYYYDWFARSYSDAPSGQTSQITTITVDFDGTQTLRPVDVKYASTNFFPVPKSASSQTIIDNRKVWTAPTDGMNVSKDVVKSIEDNISTGLYTLKPEISTDPTVNTINLYNTNPTSEFFVDNTYVGVYDLQNEFDVADFDTSLQYSFNISFQRVEGAPPQFITIPISGSSSGVPDEYATFAEFIESIIEEAGGNITAVVDNATGQLTIAKGFSSVGISDVVSTIPSASNNGFFEVATYLPFRTYKNHSRQQFGFVLTDDAGRQTSVITSDNLTLDIPHFLNSLNQPQTFAAYITGLSSISLPSDARVLSIMRKRSDSYQKYIQFALSSSNTVSQSWNYDRPYDIGFINLEIDEPSPIDLNNNKNLYISLNAVNGGDGFAYESVFDTSILDFLPQKGDVLRFLYKMDSAGAIDEVYEASFNIDLYDERTNTIVVNFNDLEDNEPTLATYLEGAIPSVGEWEVRVMCEVIQRPKESDQSFYWETAAQLSCTSGSVDITTTAFDGNIIIFGDAYLKLRGYCINYLISGTNGKSRFQNFVLQDPNFNDFADTNNVGEGRPNIVTKSLRRGQNEYVETTRDNLLRYSEQSIQNTDVRRYGTVYDENIQEVDNVFGRIEKIDGEGDILNIYQEDKISRILVGRSVTTELSGDQRIIASQKNVFSDVIYNNYDGGISIESESFAKSGYQKYFTDSKRGKVYRQSMDGITPISEVGMSGYFKDLFRKVRNSFTTPTVRGMVDERTDEYILSVTYSEAMEVEVISANSGQFNFQKPTDSVDFTSFADGQIILIDTGETSTKYSPSELEILANQTEEGIITVAQDPSNLLVPGDIVRASIPKNETLVYSERTKGWTTFLDYTAEWMETGIQSYHTFFNGEMWLHDLGNVNYCTFFGTDKNASVTVIGNASPTTIKEWRVARVKANTEDISVEAGDILTQTDQLSEIPSGSWRKYEGEMRSPFYRDSTQNLQSGGRLKGRWLQMKVTFNGYDVNEKKIKCFSVAMKAIDSPESF